MRDAVYARAHAFESWASESASWQELTSLRTNQLNVTEYANGFKLEQMVKAAKAEKSRSRPSQRGKNTLLIAKGTHKDAPPLPSQVTPTF